MRNYFANLLAGLSVGVWAFATARLIRYYTSNIPNKWEWRSSAYQRLLRDLCIALAYILTCSVVLWVTGRGL